MLIATPELRYCYVQQTDNPTTGKTGLPVSSFPTRTGLKDMPGLMRMKYLPEYDLGTKMCLTSQLIENPERDQKTPGTNRGRVANFSTARLFQTLKYPIHS
jgi:hypothetical protein